MIIKYPQWEDKLSLDDNNFPVAWGIDINWNIKQLLLTSNGAVVTSIAPINTSATGALISGQVKIATTGTQVQLPSANVGQFVVIKALSTNVSNIYLWPTGVTNTWAGTGNGVILEPGDMIPVVVDNLNKIFINWTLNDVVSYSLT